jgi:hypothetical protein
MRLRTILRGSCAAVTAAAALTAMAVPAIAASGSGSGGSGTLTTDLTFVSHPSPDCATANNGFGATTTISGTVSSGSASYTGPITFTWRVDQTSNFTWYEDPEGTHGTDSNCNGNQSDGVPWDITGYASGTNSHGSTITCNSVGSPGTGEYSRTNDVDVVVTLDLSCSIAEHGSDGNDTVTNSATTFTLTTTLGTCVDTSSPPDFIPEYCPTTDSFSAS